MPIPDFQSLMLPVLRIAAEGEAVIGDTVARLADAHALTQEERAALLPSGRQTTFANRVHWAKSHLGKAGLVALTARGRFAVTERGREVLANPPPRLTIRYLDRFPEFASFRRGDGDDAAVAAPSSAEAESLTPDEAVRRAAEQLDAALADELLARVRAAPPAFFERLVVRLLIAMGYGGSLEDAGRAMGGSGDGGIDGVIDEDALGLDRVYVQAKRYAAGNTVGPEVVRGFFGALDGARATKGVLVTTSSFTPQAEAEAARFSRRIVLVDGQRLARLMVRHEVGCRTVETVRLRRLDEDAFEA